MHDVLRSSWFWWALAFALYAAEALLPGVFMLWLGFAATGVAAVTLFLPLDPWIQWSLFSVLSVLSVYLGWRWKKQHVEKPTDQPLLNRRAQQYVGRVVTLQTAIENGRGRAHVGDTLWAVTGPDAPAGSRVRIIGVDGARFEVEHEGV